MAIPFILIALGAAAGASGTAMGVHSVVKIKDSKDYMSEAERIQNNALERFNMHSRAVVKAADSLGMQEIKIMETFRTFSDYIEKIQERPLFNPTKLFSLSIDNNGIKELRKESSEVSILRGTAGSMAIGTAGGFAATGATTSAVSVLCTASTGTAIANLSGAAATKATLATLGGGSLASGGGGMALGSTVLGVSSAGIGLLVGGAVFELTAKKLSDAADTAMIEAKKTEKQVRELIYFFDELRDVIDIYGQSMSNIADKYFKKLQRMIAIIKRKSDCRWSNFTEDEKRTVEHTILYVTILYNMCKVQITKRRDGGMNVINRGEIQNMLEKVERYFA